MLCLSFPRKSGILPFVLGEAEDLIPILVEEMAAGCVSRVPRLREYVHSVLSGLPQASEHASESRGIGPHDSGGRVGGYGRVHYRF